MIQAEDIHGAQVWEVSGRKHTDKTGAFSLKKKEIFWKMKIKIILIFKFQVKMATFAKVFLFFCNFIYDYKTKKNLPKSRIFVVWT